MPSLAELSLARIRGRLPEFPGATLPQQLEAGLGQAEAALRKYVPDFRFDVAAAEATMRHVDAWAQRNQQALSEALQQSGDELPAALHLALGSAEQVQQFVLASFTLAAAGLGPWRAGEVARLVGAGEQPRAWAEQDAESRLQTVGLIVRMEQDGELEAIFRPAQAAAGVGGLPAAAVVWIVIAAVFLAAVVITALYLMQRLEVNNRLMRDICQRAQEEGDTEVVKECIKATRDLQVSFMEEAGGQLVTVALVIGGVVLAGKLAPWLLRKGPRREAAT